MLHRFIVSGMCVCTAMLAWAQPAQAQQQTVNFTLGYFTPHSEDARTSGDVVNANLNAGRSGLFHREGVSSAASNWFPRLLGGFVGVGPRDA